MNQDNSNMQNQDPTTTNPTAPPEKAPGPMAGGAPQQVAGGKKNLMILAAIVALVIIGGVITWKLMTDGSRTAKTNQTAGNFDTPKDTVTTVSAKVKDLVGTQGAFTYSTPETSTDTPQVYVSKDDYAVAVDTTADLYVSLDLTASPLADSAEAQNAATKKAEDLSTQLSDYLKATNAFTVTTIQQNTPTGAYSNKILFSKSGLVCEVSVFVNYDSSVSIACVKQADADAALVTYAPLITEYLKHGDKVTTYSLAYQDGKNDYKIANLFAGINKYAFLQKSGASDWHYFGEISSQSPENCSLYEADADAALAFAGDTCYRNDVSSTVGGR